MSITEQINQYAAGPSLLREAVAGMSDEQLRARPIPGKWSTHEVLCHLADFEPIFVTRLKSIICFDQPALQGYDENVFFQKLAYDARDPHEELAVIESIRASMTRILRTLSEVDFQRAGVHSELGTVTLDKLLGYASRHLPHHVQFIQEKRKSLGIE
jgi:uncharacterized damage-inducible protein DinB